MVLGFTWLCWSLDIRLKNGEDASAPTIGVAGCEQLQRVCPLYSGVELLVRKVPFTVLSRETSSVNALYNNRLIQTGSWTFGLVDNVQLVPVELSVFIVDSGCKQV